MSSVLPEAHVAPFYCNNIVGMPSPSASGQKLLLTLPEILDVDNCQRKSSEKDFHWHLVLLSNYMIDVPWLMQSKNCGPALTPRCGCEKLVVLTGDSDTSGVVDSLGAAWGQHQDTTETASQIVVGYGGSGGMNSGAGMEPTLLVKPEGGVSDVDDATSPTFSSYAITRARLAAALGNNNSTAVLKSYTSSKTTCFARVIKPYLPIAYGTHHTKAVIAVNEYGIRVAIFTANFIHDDWNNKNQGIYCEDFPYKTSSPSTNSTSPMEQDLVRYFSAAGWRDAGRVLSLFDFTSASVSIVASVPGYHQRNPSTPSTGGTTWGMWHLQEQLKRHQSHFSLLRNKIDLLRSQFPSPVYTATSWNDWASKLWSARHPTHLTWQYSSQGSLTPSFLEALSKIMCQNDKVEKVAGLQQHVKVVFPTTEEVRNSVEGWRGGSSIPVPSKNLHASINERLHRFGGGDDEMDTSHPRRRAMPHIKSYSYCSSFRSGSSSDDNAVTSGLEWFLLTSSNLSRAAWGDEQKKASQLMVRSYELGVLYTGANVNANKAASHTITPWAIGSGYGPAGKRIALVGTSGTATSSNVAATIPFTKQYQSSVFAQDGVFLAPIWGLDASGVSVGVVAVVPLPYDPISPQPYSSTVALHLQNELQLARGGPSSPSSSSTQYQQIVRLPDGVSPSAPPAFRQEIVMRDVPWVVDTIHVGSDSLGMSDQANRLTHSHYGPQCWSATTLNFSGSKKGLSKEDFGDVSMVVGPSSSSPSLQQPWRKLTTGARRPRSPSGTAADIITISSDDE